MAQVILITSGKGGTGKSVVCAYLGAALAKQEKKVLLIEGTHRSLDVIFGIADRVVYDLSDAAAGRCELTDAVFPCGERENLHLICAPVGREFSCDASTWKEILKALDGHFDFILVEADGTKEQLEQLFAPTADRAVIVSTPDQISARAGRIVSDKLFGAGIKDIRLCVNMLGQDFAKKRPIPHLDWLIDNICAQLIAVVPLDHSIMDGISTENPLNMANVTKSVFDNFAQRIMGNYIDLLVR